MNFLDIEGFEFVKQKDSLLHYKRRSDALGVSAIPYSGNKWSSGVNEAFFQNLEALNLLSHPNIIKTLGHSIRDTDNGSELIIFIEKSDCTLEEYLETEILSKDDIKSILRDVILTLSYIEEKLNISPFYLTPRNIIITKNYFGDNTFKLFCPLMTENGVNLKAEDAKWTSPELYEKIRFENGAVNFQVFRKSVIYSLGLLSIFMISGDGNLIQLREFYNYDEFNAQIKEIEDKNIKRYISETAGQLKDPHLMDLILKMLRFSVIDRPELKDLLTKVQPAENYSSSHIGNRDIPRPRNNQDGYGIFIDQQEANRSNQAHNPRAAAGPQNNQRRRNFRVILAENFNKKSFTFVITTLQVIIFLITEIHMLFAARPDCILYYYGASYTPSINYYHEFFRLVTPIFLHAGWMHLIMNMTGQYYIGFSLEKFVGLKKFALIYLISGIGGNLMASCVTKTSLGVGASTSLFGLLHLNFLYDLQGMDIKAAEKKYIKQLLFCFLFSLLPGISLYGHLGGWIAGLLISTIVVPVREEHTVLQKLKPKAPLILTLWFVVSIIYILQLKGLDQYAQSINYYCHSLF